ncbi:MAG: FAD-dependent oxidoreductase [Actinobacteria bacterium]|nr:FAD-dependent oxidoreductase [Actinomycetota bacterium]
MEVAVVGGGLVGMATALYAARAGAEVTVFEADPHRGAGQSGHNSNVIHSGAFYQPGSLKASFALRGRELLEEFIEANDLPLKRCGKLVVQQDSESERFDRLVDRARANGVSHELLGSPAEIAAVEPMVTGQRAMLLADVAVTDFVAVLEALEDELALAGGSVEYMARCVMEGSQLLADDHDVRSRHVVIAAGTGYNELSSDKTWRVLGFRGTYREVALPAPGRLVYGVPDPARPFLGVHLTPALDGSVAAGPTASPHPPFAWRLVPLVARNVPAAFGEARTQLFAGAMQKNVRRYVPDARVERGIFKSGVRAQAVDRRGRFVDDFVIVREPGVTAVVNAPSPAATACLAIGEHIAREVLEQMATP